MNSFIGTQYPLKNSEDFFFSDVYLYIIYTYYNTKYLGNLILKEKNHLVGKNCDCTLKNFNVY